MSDLIRDAPIGQMLRWITGNKVLLYPEESANFQYPSSYQNPGLAKKLSVSTATTDSTTTGDALDAEKANLEPCEPRNSHGSSDSARTDLERMATANTIHAPAVDAQLTRSSTTARAALERAHTRRDLELAVEEAYAEQSLRREPSRPIQPQIAPDGTILVDWYTTDDPENPQNVSCLSL